MPFDENAFQRWYAEQAGRFNLNPNPDDPLHHYDYRAAYSAGIRRPDSTGHWPSTYKDEGHPDLIIDGVNTKTGDKVMTPEEIRKKRIELGAHQTERPPVLLELAGTDPALADEFLQRIGMAEKQGPSLMGPGSTTTMEGMEVPEITAGETQAQTMSRYPAAEGGQTEPAGTMPPPDKKGDASWTNAATLALANSMPELIKAAYQRPERPKGQSVGGGKPAFQMADPFGKRERFRSMMAQYLR